MVKDYQRLWRDVTNASTETQAVRTLAEISIDKEGRDFISRLKRKDAELCIEVLDRGIARHELKTTEKQCFFVTLRRLAAIHERLPESMVIAGSIEVEDKILVSGGFSDVRCGKYKGHRIAAKALRVAMQDDLSKLRKQFCKEVVLWSTLSHPNVLKLEGVHGDLGEGQFITISEWMRHGNIMEYIKQNEVNRLELLQGAAEGLEYLHGASLIHGDLKGANILVSNDTPPRACLADFGFMTMVLDPDHPMSCSATLSGGTTAFMSPELLAPQELGAKDSKPTREADVYAFGLVIFQVLTGEVPFPGFGPTGHIVPVIKGMRPPKPNNAPSIGLSDLLWAFVQRCWSGNTKLRPKVDEVVACLSQVNANWEGVMPRCVQAVHSAASSSQEMESDLEKYRRLLEGPQVIGPEKTTNPQVTPSLSQPSPPSTSCTELLQVPQVTAPVAKPRVPTSPADELHYPHLDQTHEPPRSRLPQKRWTSFKSLKHRFRRFFGLPPRP